jgi:hypothetical protein
MRWLATVLVSLSALSALSALPAQAAVTLDAQTREVSYDSLFTVTELVCLTPQSCSVISQTQTPDSGSGAAPDFAPYDASLASSIFEAAASQQSTVSPSRMLAHGSHAATGGASLTSSGGTPPILTQTIAGHGTRSLYRVEFTLDEPTDYTLDGTIAGGGAGFIGQLQMEIALRRMNGEVVHRIALQDDDNCFLDPECADLGPLSLDESGTLAAGSYVLEAWLIGQTEALVTFQVQVANAHTGSFDVDLQLGAAVPISPLVGPVLALCLAECGRRAAAARSRAARAS